MDFGSSFFVRYVMYLKEVFSIRKSRDEYYSVGAIC
ncbi:hypothetical protein SAMN05421857_3373 [Chryseobacterium formosense]|nr:hypothetical protein SAMN05421857_3373 [Chryseobacterium formosense]